MNRTNRYSGFEDLLQSFTAQFPDLPALLYEKEGGAAALSRGEFAACARSRAGDLAAEGKTCLGILCDGSLNCVLTIFGSVLAGLQTVLLDSNASEELLRAQITATDIDYLWGDPDLAEDLSDDLTAGIRDGSGRGNVLFFTSGTTAGSKAVVLTDASLMAAACNGSCMLALSPDDILMCMLPLNHVFGFVCSLLWGFQCAAPVALGRGMRYYAQDLAFFKPTVLSAVPLLLDFLLSHQLINPQLRLVLIGAGDCPPAVLESASALGLKLSFGYGLTETSSGVAISHDPCALEICPEDMVTLAEDGEILVRSENCMMQGYYRQPEETARVLKDGVLYTGDLGRWNENGKLQIIGRKKEMLVLGDGTKIFLPEYEESIRAVLPGEDFAAALLNGKPVLYVFDGNKDKIDREKTISRLLEPVMKTLPRGQKITRIILTDKPIPRTVTGKVRRWELGQ